MKDETPDEMAQRLAADQERAGPDRERLMSCLRECLEVAKKYQVAVVVTGYASHHASAGVFWTRPDWSCVDVKPCKDGLDIVISSSLERLGGDIAALSLSRAESLTMLRFFHDQFKDLTTAMDATHKHVREQLGVPDSIPTPGHKDGAASEVAKPELEIQFAPGCFDSLPDDMTQEKLAELMAEFRGLVASGEIFTRMQALSPEEADEIKEMLAKRGGPRSVQ